MTVHTDIHNPCLQCEQRPIDVRVPSELAKSPLQWVKAWEEKPIDNCIARIVKALNNAGIHTVNSCCGHGDGRSHIDLLDGRVIEIHRSNESYDEAR